MKERAGKPSSYYPSLVFLSLFASLLLGCGNMGEQTEDSVGAYVMSSEFEPKANEGLTATESEKVTSGSESETAPLADRKIIYVSEIRLVLKKKTFEEFEEDIKILVDKHEGYHSEVVFNGYQGHERSGRWVLRVPVDQYQSFINSVKDLGVPEQVQEIATDVTAEYVDLDARISNQKRLEQRILGVLDEVQGKIGDVLEVEQQLSRVRETIERMEGKMRQLKDRVSMTTITLNVREDESYQPPQALSFGSAIGDAWSKSIAAMEIFFKGLTLAIVALSPWLLILIPLGYLFYRLFRRLFAKRE
jgi:hypothetical protein